MHPRECCETKGGETEAGKTEAGEIEAGETRVETNRSLLCLAYIFSWFPVTGGAEKAQKPGLNRVKENPQTCGLRSQMSMFTFIIAIDDKTLSRPIENYVQETLSVTKLLLLVLQKTPFPVYYHK